MSTEPNATTGIRCPVCGKGHLEDRTITDRFEIGGGKKKGKKKRTVVAENVPVQVCTSCGETFSGPDAGLVRQRAICRTLGLLTPDEILAIRDRLGLSQAEFAKLTRIGEATIFRWENGRLLQNPAMDRYLRLIDRNPENVRVLRERLRTVPSHSTSEVAKANDLLVECQNGDGDRSLLAVEPGVVFLQSQVQEHYVYLYIDNRERVRYVGYGRESERASSHLTGSHNEGLNQFLAERRYRIEIAGPFEDERIGRAVETALISALEPEFNIDHGPSRWRFRPLGVPTAFANRLVAPELQLSDFLNIQGPTQTPVLFVIVTDIDFPDRVGYNPVNPPSDEQIRERVDRWWQLKKFLPAWDGNRDASPGLLVGVFGSPGRQTVIASARIDRYNWAEAEKHRGGRIRVPLSEPLDLDAFDLRGRRIARSAGLRFNSFPAQSFILLGLDGSKTGGRPSAEETHVAQ